MQHRRGFFRSPIFNLSNNKIIGLHYAGSSKFNFNHGIFLKAPINKFKKFFEENTNINTKGGNYANKIYDDLNYSLPIGNPLYNSEININTNKYLDYVNNT